MNKLFHNLQEETQETNFIAGIFPKKHISVIASKAGVGKTWFLLKLITDLSKGGTIFNTMAYYQKPERSLFLCGETGLEVLIERQKKMHDKADNKNIFIVSRLEAARAGKYIEVSDGNGLKPVYEFCNEIQPSLIVFDSLMSFRSDDENKAQNTTLMMLSLQRLAECYNAAIIVTHHLRKNNEGRTRIDQDELIGSSSIARLCGTAFILYKTDIDVFSLECVKTWWEKPTRVIYRMINKEGEIYFDTASSSNATEQRLKVEEYLRELPITETFTAYDICKKFNLTKNVVFPIIHKFCEKVGETGGQYSSYIFAKKDTNSDNKENSIIF